MPHKLMIKNGRIDFDILTDTPIRVDNPLVMPLIHILEHMYAVTPCQKVEVKRRPDGDLEFVITTADARIWSQQLHADGSGYVMTVDAPDFWAFTEFEDIRNVRNQVWEINRSFGIVKLDFKWL